MPAETGHHAWREGKMVDAEFIRFTGKHKEISVRAQKTKHNPFLRTAVAGAVTHWTVMLERQLPDGGGLAGMAVPFSKCGPDDPPVVAEVLHTLVHECRAALQAKNHEEFGQMAGLSAMSSFHRRDLLHLQTVARQQADRLKEILGDALFQDLIDGPKDKRKTITIPEPPPAPDLKADMPDLKADMKKVLDACGVPKELMEAPVPPKALKTVAKVAKAVANQVVHDLVATENEAAVASAADGQAILDTLIPAKEEPANVCPPPSVPAEPPPIYLPPVAPAAAPGADDHTVLPGPPPAPAPLTDDTISIF